MHYGDKEQVKRHILEVVFYKHNLYGDGENEGRYDLSLESIQECKWVSPEDLKRFLQSYKFLDPIKELAEKLEFEKWYSVSLKFPEYYEIDKVEVVSWNDVSKHPQEMMRLH